MKEPANPLRDLLRGKVVFVGVGNEIRGDDGLGPALISALKGIAGACCIDAGSAPENHTGTILKANPDTIVLVDAVHMDRAPGAYAVLREDEIGASGFTTHTASLRLLINYLKTQTQAPVYLLAVQPEDVSFGAGLTPAVSRAIAELAQILREP